MKSLFKFLRDWNGLVTLPIALFVWVVSPHLLRAMDPTAGVFDSGVLQIFLFATIGVLFADFVAWLLIQLAWPLINQYIDSESFESDFSKAPSWFRIACVIMLFAVHFLGFVLLCRHI